MLDFQLTYAFSAHIQCDPRPEAGFNVMSECCAFSVNELFFLSFFQIFCSLDVGRVTFGTLLNKPESMVIYHRLVLIRGLEVIRA